MSRVSAQRIEAMDCVRAVLDANPRSTARHIKRALREAFWRVSASRSLWYRAINEVTGGGVLDIRDRGQPELVERGPRAKRNKGGRRAR